MVAALVVAAAPRQRDAVMVTSWPPPAGPPPTFVLDDADDHGIPTVAHCDVCGGVWERPPGDSRADTLISYALEHRDAHGQAPPDQVYDDLPESRNYDEAQPASYEDPNR